MWQCVKKTFKRKAKLWIIQKYAALIDIHSISRYILWTIIRAFQETEREIQELNETMGMWLIRDYF